MADAKENKKTKRPTAIKRDIQSEKRRLINKSFKSQIRSSMRLFEETLVSKDKAAIQKALSEIYSLMDKGVKRGVFKLNKANRTKSRMTARVASVA